MTSLMESHCLSFREIPHTTKLFSSFLEDFSAVSKYYSHPPTVEGTLAAAKQVRLDPATRRSVAELLREQNAQLAPGGALDSVTARNLDRLAAGAAAIVTGQQVGLFSGPGYSIYKMASILRMAEEVTRRGTDAVPVFWLATEDHDLAEVNHVYWNSRAGLVRHELPDSQSAIGRRVGEIALGDPIAPLVESAAGSFEGGFSRETARVLRESYTPHDTFGTAFGKLMARIFAGRGVIFIDPLHPRLHHLVAPVYLRALEESAGLRDALLARAHDLESSGFHAQVKVTGESTLLFYNVDGRRQAVRARDGRFFAGDTWFSPAEMAVSARSRSEAFSPSVLFRPIVQDSLLPTAAYIGGPAEVAYMAQVQVVYQHFLGRMPAILPRSSFTIVEPAIARFLSKFELTFRDFLQGPQHVRATMERKAVPEDLARRFDADEKNLRATLESYAASIEKLDRTLLGTLESSTEKMLHQFGKLKEGVGRALNFRTGVLDNKQRILFDSLYPNHELQERSLCGLPYLAKFGPQLLDTLIRFSSPPGAEGNASCAHQHHVLFL